jgi:hypothetical protein
VLCLSVALLLYSCAMFITFSIIYSLFGFMLCPAVNTLLCPRVRAHTHTQIYRAYVRKVFVININIIGVDTVKVLDRRSWALYER